MTDHELKTVTNWGGIGTSNVQSPYPTYDVNNLYSVNKLLTNNGTVSTVGNTTSPAICYVNLVNARNIYLKSPNLSSFNTIGCNGESTVNVGPGDMITSNITSATDFLDCSRATWKTIEIMIQDVHGNEINLHGSNWSFNILFDIANPNI